MKAKSVKNALKLTSLLLLSLSLLPAGCGSNQGEEPAPQTEEITAEADSQSDNEAVQEAETEAAKTQETSQSEEAGQDLPILTVASAYDNMSNEDYGENYKLYATMKADGFIILNDGYEELQKALQENSRYAKDDINFFKENYLGDTASLEEIVDESGMQLYYKNTAYVKRLDANVLSIERMISSFAGGAHPSSYYEDYTFDVSSGRELERSDVITDETAFEELLYSKLEECPQKEEFFEDWKDTVANELSGQEDYKLVWGLTDNGFLVTFNNYDIAPYAAGPVLIEIPYEELTGIIDEKYVAAKGPLCHLVCRDGNWNEYYFDANGDGQEELLRIESEPDPETEDEFGYAYSSILSVRYGQDEGSLKTETYQVMDSFSQALVAESSDGKTYLYVSCPAENDYSYLLIYDLSDPAAGPVSKGMNESGSFYSSAQTAGNFVISDRINIMGTYSGYSRATIGAEGQLILNGDYEIYNYDYDAVFDPASQIKYTDDSYRQLTLLQDTTAEDESGNPLELKKDEKLIPVRTDNSSYMIFSCSDGSLVKIKYDEESIDSWPRTINGIDEESLFEGIMYAG